MLMSLINPCPQLTLHVSSGLPHPGPPQGDPLVLAGQGTGQITVYRHAFDVLSHHWDQRKQKLILPALTTAGLQAPHLLIPLSSLGWPLPPHTKASFSCMVSHVENSRQISPLREFCFQTSFVFPWPNWTEKRVWEWIDPKKKKKILPKLAVIRGSWEFFSNKEIPDTFCIIALFFFTSPVNTFVH